MGGQVTTMSGEVCGRSGQVTRVSGEVCRRSGDQYVR
jgi:hypothetical protein